jgi:hypothetical protein
VARQITNRVLICLRLIRPLACLKSRAYLFSFSRTSGSANSLRTSAINLLAAFDAFNVFPTASAPS